MEEEGLSDSEMKFVTLLINLGDKDYTKTEIANRMNINISDIRFSRIFKALEEKEALIFKKRFASALMYHPDKKKIIDFINKSQIARYWATYFNKTNMSGLEEISL